MRDAGPQNCSECRYWSARLAYAIGGGPVQAMCLEKDSRHHGKYTTGRMVCAQWAPNDLGAIDDRYWEETGEDPIATYAGFDRSREQ